MTRAGYQGEPHPYSHRAVGELCPGAEAVGFGDFGSAFEALSAGAVDELVLPIENSTTGSVLEVLDRLAHGEGVIVAEHRIEIRHALMAVPGASLSLIHI
mgnify:CR=1 FL=1